MDALRSTAILLLLACPPIGAVAQEHFPARTHDTILGITLEKTTVKRLFATLGETKRKRDPSVGDRHFLFGYCYCSAPDCAIRLTFELPDPKSTTLHGYVLEKQSTVDERCALTDKLSPSVRTDAGVTLGMTRQALEACFPASSRSTERR